MKFSVGDLVILKDGVIRLTGKKDNEPSIVDIAVITEEPRWKNQNPTEIFEGDEYFFDGTLRNLDRPSDNGRYKLEVSGDFFSQPFKEIGRTKTFQPFKKPGNFSVQVYVDDSSIPGMIHKVNVKKPPPPTISYTQNQNIVKLTVEAYGAKNSITKIYFLGGYQQGSHIQV